MIRLSAGWRIVILSATLMAAAPATAAEPPTAPAPQSSSAPQSSAAPSSSPAASPTGPNGMVITDAGPAPVIGKTLCPVLSEYSDGVPLPQVQAALRVGGRLNILVVGSGTVLGPETSNLAASFPYRMARALKAAVPGAEVTLTVRGGKGLTAAEMLPIIKSELAAGHYRLVVWQTGTVEAVRSLSADDLAETLAAGVEEVAAAGSDLVLVDPQYSRFLRANANLDPYERALEQAAAAPDVSLFRRFDLMHSWVEDGGIDLERAATADRHKVAELLHACLGRALASLVLNEAGLQAALAPATTSQ